MEKRKRIIHILFIILAGWIVTGFYSKFLGSPGDQNWFKETIESFQYDYINFALVRYVTWSSRLLLEIGMAFLSVHQSLFRIAIFASSSLFILFSTNIVRQAIGNKENDDYIKALVPLIFILIFDVSWFLSAGLVATYVVYFFPMLSVMTILVAINYDNNFLKALAILSSFIAILQEQFAIFLLLISVYILINNWINNRKLSFFNIGLLLISILGFLNIKLSPGNALRTSQEIKDWFPNFNALSFFDKIFMSFIDTNNIIFSDKYIFLMVFLIICLMISIFKRDLLNVFLTLFCLFVFKFKTKIYYFTDNIAQTIKAEHAITFNRDVILTIVIYAFMLFILMVILWRLCQNAHMRMDLFFLVISGYVCRMAIAFSPTMYASLDRTLLPFVFAVFMLTIILGGNLLNLLMNQKMQYSSIFKLL